MRLATNSNVVRAISHGASAISASSRPLRHSRGARIGSTRSAPTSTRTGARYVQPEAGYLAWIDCRALGLGDDPARHFLERGRVALEHGLKFGSPGAGFARLNFGTSAGLLAVNGA